MFRLINTCQQRPLADQMNYKGKIKDKKALSFPAQQLNGLFLRAGFLIDFLECFLQICTCVSLVKGWIIRTCLKSPSFSEIIMEQLPSIIFSFWFLLAPSMGSPLLQILHQEASAPSPAQVLVRVGRPYGPNITRSPRNPRF